MEKQFVTYEIALALKELKFNEPCIAKYCRYNSSDNIELFPQSQNFFQGDGFEYCKNSEYKKEEKIAAPLWQQAIDWFREEHDNNIIIMPCFIPSNEIKYYIFKGKLKWDWNELYNTYEEAREQSILKAIELIKEN